jgi:hypothetical protein
MTKSSKTPKATERNSLGQKWCPEHKAWTSLDRFSVDNSRPDRVQRICKSCYSIYRGKHERLEQIRARKRRPETRTKLLWERARYRAKAKGVPFTIRVSDIVVPEICPILGHPLDTDIHEGAKRGPRYNSPSLDRIDPTKGYVPGNVQVISNQANVMKNNASPSELRRFARWILATYGQESS